MADDLPLPKPPTYAELVEQNEALRAEMVVLRATCEALARKLEAEQKKAAVAERRRRAPLALDPKAADSFRRPYDGR